MSGDLKPLEEKTLAEKLFTVRFKVDSASHLTLNKEICQECDERACLIICPSEVYRWDDKGVAPLAGVAPPAKEITVSYEGCLECGACRIACVSGAIDWRSPRGGFGVSYRFG